MNKIEVAELIKTVIRYYPNFKFDDMDKITNAWLLILHDEDTKVVAKNLADHVKTDRFPPTIADLLKKQEPKEVGRAIPNHKETQALLAAPFENRKVATEEERQSGLAAIREVLRGLNV